MMQQTNVLKIINFLVNMWNHAKPVTKCSTIALLLLITKQHWPDIKNKNSNKGLKSI